MKKINIFFIFVTLIMLAACSSNKVTETPNTQIDDGNVLGHLTVTVDVVNRLSTAAFTPNLSSQDLTDVTGDFSGASFTAGTIATTVVGSTSHVAFPYTFTTPAGSGNHEFYLIPVTTPNTIVGTPFSKVFDYAGNPLTVGQLQNLAMSAYVDPANNSYTTNVPPFDGSTPTGVIAGAAYQAKATTGSTTSIPAGAQATVVISSSLTGNVETAGSTSTIPGKYNFNFIVATQPAP